MEALIPIDRLGSLPDDLIGRILSSLDLKDQAKTSVLAKKWKYIWLSVSNIRIDQNQFVGQNDVKSVRHRKTKKFKKTIDRVMASDTPLDTLDISITFAIDNNTLNLWILRAVRRNVWKISLSISKEDDNGPFEFPAILPLFPAFKSLTMESYFDVMSIPICRYLEELCLFQTNFGEDRDLYLQFSDFFSLKKIELEDVNDALRLTIVSPNLKTLVLHGARNLQELRIITPVISDFYFIKKFENLVPELLHLGFFHTTSSQWCRCSVPNNADFLIRFPPFL